MISPKLKSYAAVIFNAELDSQPSAHAAWGRVGSRDNGWVKAVIGRCRKRNRAFGKGPPCSSHLRTCRTGG